MRVAPTERLRGDPLSTQSGIFAQATAGSLAFGCVTVVELWRYPVKSAQGEQVVEAAVTGLGLAWDRQLAIVDVGTGRALTGRREPRLLTLSAKVINGQVR